MTQKATQCSKLERLLIRKKGTTSMEIINVCKTVAPHRRIADLEHKGWLIRRVQREGVKHLTYFGEPPTGLPI